jgi:hypothetical protein
VEHGFTLRVSSTVMTIMATRKIRAAAIATPALAGTLAPMRSATARSQTYTPEIGKACTFPLTNTIVEQQPIFKKIFPDKKGNPIRYLFAGKTTSNTFINEQTGAGIRFEPNVGSITRGFVNDDGTITFVATGLKTIACYPTDVPAGPSTTVYMGEVVYPVRANKAYAPDRHCLQGGSIGTDRRRAYQ